MKKFKNIILVIVVSLFAFSCEDGIDDITKVDPGADATAPIIKVNYPLEGTKIQVKEIVTSINIQFEVTDDIEIGKIDVFIDNVKIVEFSEFKDYRRAIKEYLHTNLTNGAHVLKIVATDIEGKATIKLINFEKVSPYTTLFNGEVLYMSFDGDYLDLISFKTASKVGTPGFTTASFAGLNAYKGATDSYLTFPTTGLLSAEFSAGFWYKVDASPDRSGILTIGKDDNRTQGFRLFREGSGAKQRIKLNVGTGNGESWNDGGEIDVAAGQWVYVAFTISPINTKIYFNGILMNTAGTGASVDWSGCNSMSIGSGAPTFSYWDHKSDKSSIDELRIFNKALSQSEIQNIINVTNPYTPKYAGETFYMPFNGTNTELITNTEASKIGLPTFAGSGFSGGNSYKGATDSYLTYPINGLFGNEFSGSFWYKVNGTPDRSGILVVGNNVPENRNQGFRLFREGSPTNQRLKLNVGTGNGESWNDGGVIDVTAGEWVHVVFTVSQTKSTIYFNGVEMLSSTLSTKVDWTGCNSLSIGSGAPTFSYWDHKSDQSNLDELRLFNKALSLTEVQKIYNDK
ncbi:LamG domain-containing protein [Lutibacter sp.]|uniref:LamG domain-containing protein n=1 Tax=Lutibacter sp. TaxID=1925666 RepID=UPI00273570D0|nr:LamG domain-containing protein [Lutibacter sp.]MDP3314106.1 LamG domain-containing protein [Lutibacter sp.]